MTLKDFMRASAGCLFIALALNAAFTQVLAPADQFKDLPWLRLIFHENKHRPQDVTIITKAQPQVTKLRENQWQISFWP